MGILHITMTHIIINPVLPVVDSYMGHSDDMCATVSVKCWQDGVPESVVTIIPSSVLFELRL